MYRKMSLGEKNHYCKCKFPIFVICQFSIKMFIFFSLILLKYFVHTMDISTLIHSASFSPSLLLSFYILFKLLNNQIYQFFLFLISLPYTILTRPFSTYDKINVFQYFLLILSCFVSTYSAL